MEKTLNNTDQDAAKKNVSDLVIFGGDLFKLLSKASSQKEGWMKSTKAMEIEGVGCAIQVTTQQKDDTGLVKMYSALETQEALDNNVDLDYSATTKGWVIAEAVTFIPGVKIEETLDDNGIATSRKLISINK